jgi:hypothetical protein
VSFIGLRSVIERRGVGAGARAQEEGMGPDGWDVLDGPSPPSGWRIEVHQGPLFGGTRTRRAVVPRPATMKTTSSVTVNSNFRRGSCREPGRRPPRRSHV